MRFPKFINGKRTKLPNCPKGYHRALRPGTCQMICIKNK